MRGTYEGKLLAQISSLTLNFQGLLTNIQLTFFHCLFNKSTTIFHGLYCYPPYRMSSKRRQNMLLTSVPYKIIPNKTKKPALRPQWSMLITVR